MDYRTYLNFGETMFKRLWWQGFKGRFCAFRWDTLVVATVADIPVSNGEYNNSEDRAWRYGESLRSFGSQIERQGFTVSLIGHSMGNIVCGSSLQKSLSVQNYILMEAAVPAGCYDVRGSPVAGDVNGYMRFWKAEAGRETPDFDQVPNGAQNKGYRGFLEGISDNVAGAVVNFHNRLDYALATGYIVDGVEANWEANEENYKPDERAELKFGSGISRYVTDAYEMKSFVARPRSRAVGAVDTLFGDLPGGAISENVNLFDYGFRDQDYDHSGQFNRRIQQLNGLYRRVFDIVK